MTLKAASFVVDYLRSTATKHAVRAWRNANPDAVWKKEAGSIARCVRKWVALNCLLLTLSAHASYPRTDATARPFVPQPILCQQSRYIDGGRRILFTTTYRDGTVRRFVIEIPKLRP